MTLHVLRVPTREIGRKPADERWCFNCRKRLEHAIVVTAPVDPMSYYGPNWVYECARCKGDYVDFPGCFSGRGWTDE
jgi:short subunit dehydrogenase-like uncharacterized protein